MWVLTIFLLSAVSLSTTTPFLDFIFPQCFCNCGISVRHQRILGGQTTELNEFPWLAYLKIQNKLQTTGILINDRYVLTLASLLIGITPYDVKVTLGLQDRCNNDAHSINQSVNAILIHHGYSTTTKIHDIALLRLNAKVNFDRFISPICLGEIGKSYIGQVGHILGYSNNKNTGILSFCRPLKLGLPVLSTNQCFLTSPNKQYFTSDKNCVGVIGAVNGICKNDAGGPVMYKNIDGQYDLIGILSDENVCGGPPSTAMYTKISNHLNWIKDHTKDACYCAK